MSVSPFFAAFCCDVICALPICVTTLATLRAGSMNSRYRRQREYPQPPPPNKSTSKITINRVSIVSPLFGLSISVEEQVVCQNLLFEKGCNFRLLLSSFRETRMKEPSRQSNRSTKRSNLISIRGRPLTNRCDLIWPDFRGTSIQFAAP